MNTLVLNKPIKVAKSYSDPLQNQLYERMAEKILRDEFTEAKVLSYRENRIAVYLAKGREIDWVADRLNISPETVVTHRKNIYTKLEIHSKAGLISWLVISFFKNEN
jgi:DNA-binding CsgD family transcriptional regulator